ncbi:MAG: HAD-IA family hydrolase [Eggerthellaceae bacterium]|nr:HAD-IA family hydrolase [Eggerthellaceae bacterium]
MARIKAILFDNDGTLVDTHDLLLDSFQYATRTVLGVDLPEEVLMAGVGTPLADQMKDFTDDPKLQQELLTVYRDYNHARHDEAIALFPGVLETLRSLHVEGYKMGVVTAKMHALAWHGLEIMGIAPYMDCLIGPDDCPKSKPAPAPILMGCKLLGVAPSECLYVGDSPYDMRAGREAGCDTAAALWGMFERSVLENEKPTHFCTRFQDVATLAS